MTAIQYTELNTKITKVQYKNSQVDISFIYNDGDEDIDGHLKHFDEPLPSFDETLQALAQHVNTICEFPAGYFRFDDGSETEELFDSQKIKDRIQSVSFNYAKSNNIGAVITGLRYTQTARSPVVINTPNIYEDTTNDNDPYQPTLPWECSNTLHDLRYECLRYLNKERAETDEQLDLLDEIEARAADEKPATVAEVTEAIKDGLEKKTGKKAKAKTVAEVEVDPDA